MLCTNVLDKPGSHRVWGGEGGGGRGVEQGLAQRILIVFFYGRRGGMHPGLCSGILVCVVVSSLCRRRVWPLPFCSHACGPSDHGTKEEEKSRKPQSINDETERKLACQASPDDATNGRCVRSKLQQFVVRPVTSGMVGFCSMDDDARGWFAHREDILRKRTKRVWQRARTPNRK